MNTKINDSCLQQFIRKLNKDPIFINHVDDKKNFNYQELFNRNSNYAFSYIAQYKCSQCRKLSTCKNNIPGYQVKVEYNNKEKKIYFHYDKCPLYIKESKEMINDFTFKINHSSEDQRDMRFDSLSRELSIEIPWEVKPIDDISMLFDYCRNSVKNNDKNFLYYYNIETCYKTSIAIATCNEYHNIYPTKSVAYVKIPLLLQMIRANMSFSQQSSNKMTTLQIINYLSNCDLLVIDDFGNDIFSQWFHMEFLIPILEKRFSYKRKKTFVFSNYSTSDIKLNYLNGVNNKKNSSSKNNVTIFINKIRNIENEYRKNK